MAKGAFAEVLQGVRGYFNRKLDEESAVEEWGRLDLLIGKLSEWKDSLRTVIMESAIKHGERDAKGSYKWACGGASVQRQRKLTLTFDPALVAQLIKSKGLPLEAAGTLVFKPEEKKLEAMIGRGELLVSEVSACTTEKEVFALLIKKNPELELEVQEAFDGTGPQVQP